MINKILLATVLASILAVFGLILYDADYADAQGLSVLKASQGGTGIGSTTAGNVGKCLQVSDDSPFAYTFGDCSGGGGGGSISTSTTPTPGHVAYWTSTSALGSVATGTLTTTATGLSFDATRGLLGGSAVLSLDAGRTIPLTASTTEWDTAYASTTALTPSYIRNLWSETVTGLDYASGVLSLASGYVIPLTASTTEWSTAYASTTALTPAYIRGLFSGTSPVSYNSGTGAIGITADAIGDTELAFNTGQHLTTTSAPTFASSTFSNLTSAVLLTTAGGLLQEYAGTACTNQFVRSLSALAAATCAAVNLTSDVTGILPIANGGTGTSTAPTTGQVLLGNASGGYNLVATSSLGITASAGGANTQIQYNSGGALAGLSTLTTDGSSLTMTGTTTLATTTVPYFSGDVKFGADMFGSGVYDLASGANGFTLNTNFVNIDVDAGDYVRFNSNQYDSDTYFQTDNALYTLFVDGGTDRVGIGTSTPAQLLTVAGTLGVTGTSTLSGKVMIGTTTPFANRIFTVDGDGYFSGETTLGSNLFVTANLGMVTDGSYISWGDESTLIGGNSSTDVLSFYTAGTENLTVYSNGNVGIGTTTPANNLTISKTGDSAIYLEADTDNATESDNPFIKFSQDGGAVLALLGLVGDAGRDPEHVLYTDTLGNSLLIGGQTTFEAIQFGTNDAVRMTIANGGNVGIGTTSPSHPLTVNGNVLARSFTSTSTSATSTLAGALNIGTTTNRAMLHVMGQTGGTLASLIGSAGTKFMEMLNTGVTTLLGSWDFGGADFLEIPNGTGNTANDPGEIAHDTSDNQLILDDYVVGKATDTIFKVTVASTSPAFTNSGLLKVPTELDGFTITAIRCSVETGTSKVVAIEDASGNSSEDITCTTSVTSDDGSITNASYTAGEELYIDFGATSGSVDYVSISVFGTWTRE